LLVKIYPDWLILQPYDLAIDKVVGQQPQLLLSFSSIDHCHSNGAGG
jgi:hypothetical protein